MDRIDKALLNKTLRSIVTDNSVSLEEFKELDLVIQKEILELVYTSQAEAIRRSMHEKNDIMLIGLGTMKIKKNRLKAIKFSEELLKEYGVEFKHELSKEQREEYSNRMEDLMRNEVLKSKGVDIKNT